MIATDEFRKPSEPRPKSLEGKNFRIDPSGWWIDKTDPNGVRYLKNPEGDVWELIDGEFAGEQFFSWDAAIRETAKSGKRLPTKEEWAAIILSINPSIVPGLGWQADASVRETLGLKLAGYCSRPPDGQYYAGPFGSYWSSSSDGTNGYLAHFSATRVIPTGLDDRSVKCSVRCMVN